MKTLGVLPLRLGFALPVRGQIDSIDRFTLDDGGGTSTGGNFTLEGGFWPGVAVATPEGPVVLIQFVGGAVSLSWSPAAPGFVLEMTDDLSAYPAAPAYSLRSGRGTAGECQ